MGREETATSAEALGDLLAVACESELGTVYSRAAASKPCPIGRAGACCSVCYVGPCRLSDRRPELTGICGADLATVTARHFARMVAGGVSAHADHGRSMALLLAAAARGDTPGLAVRDPGRLAALARELGVRDDATANDPAACVRATAAAVADALLTMFGGRDGELPLLARAPAARVEAWRQAGVAPRTIDREIVELMHRTGPGTDQAARSLVFSALRAALADGWGGAMIASEVSDILFGAPAPVASRSGPGVLKADSVNILVHGHSPLMAEMLLIATSEPDLVAEARAAGAAGINLAGLCCSANEVLARHGVPPAGSFLDQEVVLATGAVDAMVVDVQCVMASLPSAAARFQTAVITTDSRARIEGAHHIDAEAEGPLPAARRIVRTAIEAYGRRDAAALRIPEETRPVVAGFTHESIARMLGGTHLASYRPLNDAIIDGRLQGVVAIVGCTNPRSADPAACAHVAEELARSNVLVVQTGCAAVSCSIAGLMEPEAREDAGPILEVVCKSVGCPPALHMGACVDNARVLLALTAMVEAGGLGDDISDLPVAGICPEWMSEKAIAIGSYFAASGVRTVFGVGSPVAAGGDTASLLDEGVAHALGGSLLFESDPQSAVRIVLDRLKERRERLGLGAHRDREVHDVDRRRALIWWKNRLRNLRHAR